MKSKVVVDLLQKQFTMERQAYNYYLALSVECEAKKLPGCAKWFRKQSEEEMTHAMRIFDFLLDIGEKPQVVEVKDYSASASMFASEKTEILFLRRVFESALSHEQEVTKAIHAIAKQSIDDGDFACLEIIQWFVKEQVEEEKSVQDILDKIDVCTNVFLLDHFITE